MLFFQRGRVIDLGRKRSQPRVPVTASYV